MYPRLVSRLFLILLVLSPGAMAYVLPAGVTEDRVYFKFKVGSTVQALKSKTPAQACNNQTYYGFPLYLGAEVNASSTASPGMAVHKCSSLSDGSNWYTGTYAIINWCADPEKIFIEDAEGQGTGDCGYPPPPACPNPGEVEMEWTIGGVVENTCELLLTPWQQFDEFQGNQTSNGECKPIGTIDTGLGPQTICATNEDACQGFGTNAMHPNGQQICVPYTEDAIGEQCLHDEYLVTDRYGNSYCSQVIAPETEEPPPGVEENPDCPDVDGDGICNDEDDDIDGDGTPNNSDNDSDGDGIPDPNDPSPNGEQAPSEKGSVAGGGDCQAAPNCKGDALQCAIVFQTWKTRCALQVDQEEINKLVENGPGVDDLTGDPVDLQSDLDGVFSTTGAAGSCPADMSLNLSGTQIPIPWTFLCDFAETIRPMVILLFGFVGFRIVMRAF